MHWRQHDNSQDNLKSCLDGWGLVTIYIGDITTVKVSLTDVGKIGRYLNHNKSQTRRIIRGIYCVTLQSINYHYDDVVMGAIASEITRLTIVYSTVYSDADQRKHQSTASLASVRGIHRGPVHLMTSSITVTWHERHSVSTHLQLECFCQSSFRLTEKTP